MPPFAGETLLTTLFADIHYFLSDPGARPVHDRFDKASYVYLYHNQIQRTTRIEVANSPSTPHQDAFNGYLGNVVVKHTYQQPNLLSIVLHSPPNDDSHWCLPAYDLRSDQKYLYRLHSLDVYFWTVGDASQFIDFLQRHLPQNLDLIEPPSAAETQSLNTAEHRDSMSPVVEKLEQAAISSPPREHMSSSASARTMSLSTPLQPVQMAPAVAPYNPAAPAAPEPIAHREKTPPPVDAESGTGLNAVAANEQGVMPPFARQSSYQQVPRQLLHSGPLASMPPPPAHPSHGAVPSSSSPFPGLPQPPPSSQVGFVGHSHQSQSVSHSQHGYPPSPGLPLTPSAPPAYGYSSPLSSPGLVHGGLQSPGLPHTTAGPPIGGYSSYSYGKQTQHPDGQSEPYGVHNIVYNPTEAEAAHSHEHKPAKSGPVKPGGFEDRVERLEKGVGRFLRRLDKKI